MQWTVIRQELGRKPGFRVPEYTFIGLSLLNREKIAGVQLLRNAAPDGRIFGFFDLLHPAVFLVWNNSRKASFVDLGPVMVAVPPGASRVSFFPGSVFLLRQDRKQVVKYFGAAIVGRVWRDFLAKKILRGHDDPEPMSGSFIVKSPETSPYLRVPYLVYFFLPFLFICAAVIRFGPVMLAAFLYFVEMFFLFDFQGLFVTVPYHWLFRSMNGEIPETTTQLIAGGLALVFLACAVLGFWHWKKREISAWPKRILLFFVLLPLVLFF